MFDVVNVIVPVNFCYEGIQKFVTFAEGDVVCAFGGRGARCGALE